MTTRPARVLLVADTHLGFDLPFRPRVERRRRGPDFFANLDRALAPALEGRVDLVVHGGDLFYRSRVPAALVEMAMAPLVRVAQAGVPVYLVPGNHERSRIPLHLWAAHPNLHLFHRPATFLCPTPGGTLALSGFPFARRVRDTFVDLVRQTRHHEVDAGAHLLCLHQTVEGAQVGPGNYTFRSGPDVIRATDLLSLSLWEHALSMANGRAGVRAIDSLSPKTDAGAGPTNSISPREPSSSHVPSEARGTANGRAGSLTRAPRGGLQGVSPDNPLSPQEHAGLGAGSSLSPWDRAGMRVPGARVPPFCAILAGHIHRAQTLTHDLQGRPLGIPVVYPGSVERTSFAERDEPKTYAILTVGLDGQDRNRLLEVEFVPLPARPMVSIALEPQNGDPGPLLRLVDQRLAALEPDAVVRIQIRGTHAEAARRLLTAAALRDLAPPTMNVSVAPETYRRKAE